jgi:hypothetical protein
MKLALLALATLAAASPIELAPRAELRPRENNSKLEERQWMSGPGGFVDWHGQDGKDICAPWWTTFPSHDCSILCWQKGYRYFDQSYGPTWCCCWGRR